MLREHTHFLKAALCLGLAILLGLSLVSYSSYDPSFNRASDGDIYNLLGHTGAYLADALIQLLGWSSLFIVVALLAWAKRYIYDHAVEKISLRIAVLFVALIGLSTILAYIPTPANWPLYIGFGGIVGDQLHDLLQAVSAFLILSLLLPLSAVAGLYSLTLGIEDMVRCYQVTATMVMHGLAYLQTGWQWVAERFLGRTPEEEAEEVDKETEEDDEDEENNLLNEDAEDTAEEEDEFEGEEEDGDEDLVVEQPSRAQLLAKKAALQASKLVKPITPHARSNKATNGNFVFPGLGLLVKKESNHKNIVSQSALEQNAKLLTKVLGDFGIEGKIIRVRPGPVVTLYELEPSPGTKSSRVIGLADDIARSMSAVSARISVVPGRNVLGIELPNKTREVVYLRELLETEEYHDQRIRLPMTLGKDIGGEPITVDLTKMPHLLVAGTTGSGKSVAVNAMILSFIYRLSPEECKFIMIDPKMLELSVYQGIPHLLAPVVTEPAKAVVALKWAVREMEERYRAMSHLGVRNIAGYNKRIEDAIANGEVLERQVQTGFDPETGAPVYEVQPLQMKKLPFIVVIVDEMADLMLTAGKDIESSIQRLAQMARAAGIHLIMATQRPSVDVITGVIKANFPTRISFQVTSRIDSRTILGEMGAEQLLGMGDMLYMAGGTRITRVHGPFVDDAEVIKVVNHLKAQGDPDYIDDITRDDNLAFGSPEGGSGDELYDQAVAIVLRDKKVSTSYVQRQLKIGYNRAANIIEKMEQEGIISQANHAGKREILA